jgi:hypothetical protein
MEDRAEKKERLRALMKGQPRGTQSQLARYVGVSLGQVQNWLKDRYLWTTPLREEKIWAFFAQAAHGVPPLPERKEARAMPVHADPAAEAHQLLDIVLVHRERDVRELIVQQLRLYVRWHMQLLSADEQDFFGAPVGAPFRLPEARLQEKEHRTRA